MAWTLRGSPHVHPRAALPAVAAALWPADAAAARAFLGADGDRLIDDGGDPLQAYRFTANAFRDLVTGPMTKGEASTAITPAVPEVCTGFCRGCGVVHVREMLFRSAALAGGIGAVPDTRPIVLQPLSPKLRQPETRGLGNLVAAYYDLYGAGTVPEVSAFLGTTAAVVKPLLPDGLTPVQLDGHRSLATADLLDRSPDDTDLVRLLPPADPMLAPRDRHILADNPTTRKALWPALGPPGAVLAGGGVPGFWRARSAAGTLTLTVTLWKPLTRTQKAALDNEAQLIGTVRGARRTRLAIA